MSEADVIMISGCRDDQTSADAFIANRNAGAMSSSLVDVFTKNRNPRMSFLELLAGMRSYLRDNGYEQVPQMSSSRIMDMNYTWII